MKPLVILPTYNEAENIVMACRNVRSALPSAHILVVDDNSPDGTARLVRDLDDPLIHVLVREQKSGLGPAYLAGFAWGLEQGFDRLIQMDADGSHPASRLGHLVDVSQTADLVIGSRYVDGGAVRDWPAHRVMLSRWGNRYVQIMLALGVRDATAGFRVYSDHAIALIDLASVEANGYAFQINMTWRAKQAGLRITEVPITFTDRTLGSSKMSISIVIEALLLTTRWAIRSRAAALFAPK